MHPNVCFGVYQPSFFFTLCTNSWWSSCSPALSVLASPEKIVTLCLVHEVTNRKCSTRGHFWRLTLGVGFLDNWILRILFFFSSLCISFLYLRAYLLSSEEIGKTLLQIQQKVKSVLQSSHESYKKTKG